MPTPLQDVNVGDPILADNYNRLQGGVNALLSAFGNIEVGPNGVSVPSQLERFPIELLSTRVVATADDSVTAFKVGDVVAIFGGAMDPTLGGDADEVTTSAVTVAEPVDAGHSTYGVVYEPIDGDTPGKVIVAGFAFALIVRPSTDDDDALLATHSVIRPAVFPEDTTDSIPATRGVLTYGVGIGDVIWEDTSVTPNTNSHWALIRLAARITGCTYVEAVEDQTGQTGEVKIRFLNTAHEKKGEELTLPYYVSDCTGGS